MHALAVAYLTAVNAAGFIMMGADKERAKRHEWRIPESTLLAVCAAGGSAGAWAGMRLFRHKTRKAKFAIGVPLMCAAQAVLAACVL